MDRARLWKVAFFVALLGMAFGFDKIDTVRLGRAVSDRAPPSQRDTRPGQDDDSVVFRANQLLDQVLSTLQECGGPDSPKDLPPLDTLPPLPKEYLP